MNISQKYKKEPVRLSLLILLLTCRQDHISVMRKSSNDKRKPLFTDIRDEQKIFLSIQMIFGLSKLYYDIL